jgi:hypothetical protein
VLDEIVSGGGDALYAGRAHPSAEDNQRGERVWIV